MNRLIHRITYIISDFTTATLTWVCFYIYRKIFIESVKYGFPVPIEFNHRFFVSILIIPAFWLFLYYLNGYYRNIYRKSRFQELWQTLITSIFGVIIIFFVIILDDTIITYRNYYYSFLTLLSLHFVFTYIPRLIFTTRTNNKIHKRIIGFNTIIIGSGKKAIDLYRQLEEQPLSTGNIVVGFLNVNGNGHYPLARHLKHLGSVGSLQDAISKYKIEEAIIAIESSEHEKVSEIINKFATTKVILKIIPGMYEILQGMANMSTMYGIPLIEIKHNLMPAFQENIKRTLDLVLSMIAIILLSPLYIALAVGVKLSSKGPIFYSHERIGRYGKPFTIYKFRSMFTDAEKNGPALSSQNDRRITPFGLFMRKSRLDELPQFFNVIIGDMSLVGPRPERQYFIDKITVKAPHYYHLQKVRPGITSWGQVKYGYAENVDQMIERLKYDIIYIENMSLYIDFKIMIYTILIVFKGVGK